MFEQYIKSGRETLGYLKNYREVAASVKKIIKEDYRDARVFVFGSVVRGDYTASSDIDILVVSDEVDRESMARLKTKVLRRIGLAVPIEIHATMQREFDGWYLRFIAKLVEV